MVLFLTLLSGICWTIVYIESIHIGFKNKTYAMPLFALALNVTWEGLYAFIGLNSNLGSPQAWINLCWFLLDMIIVYSYFKFGRDDFSKYVNKEYFVPVSLFIFIMSFAIEYSFYVEFAENGPVYSAYVQNLIMSILFIFMLINRKSTKGQNLIIAVSKGIGTLAPTISTGIIIGNQFVLVLGIFCAIFDIAYIVYLSTLNKVSISNSDSFILKSNSQMDSSFNSQDLFQ
ncbi:hypothetical protein [Clostridium sp.]|uniref:transmembrane-type terpene cyclase n=1 Tax=Clostridium sp. TaxID=1506 RepID=UPI00283AEAA8|nr:hypothetical protein [Clostridium sp.]MDR3598181.1 hypothetical protein [Clostridium sp.]